MHYVVGGSRLKMGCASEDGRPVRIDRKFRMPCCIRRTRLTGVRATIVALKRGNARGVKGGRKTHGVAS